MKPLQAFYEILAKTNELALATSVDNVPNVRIVNYCFDEKRPGIIYFASARDNNKVGEFAVNNKVAFTTVPTDGASVPHVRSNKTIVQKSEFSIGELSELFVKAIPGYDETLAAIGDELDVFELHVKKADLIIDYDACECVAFETEQR